MLLPISALAALDGRLSVWEQQMERAPELPLRISAAFDRVMRPLGNVLRVDAMQGPEAVLAQVLEGVKGCACLGERHGQ